MITEEQIKSDQLAWEKTKWDTFFETFDVYIKAVIVAAQSTDLEHSVRLTNLREDIIDTLINQGIKLP